jgi:hypothetical protein
MWRRPTKDDGTSRLYFLVKWTDKDRESIKNEDPLQMVDRNLPVQVRKKERGGGKGKQREAEERGGKRGENKTEEEERGVKGREEEGGRGERGD